MQGSLLVAVFDNLWQTFSEKGLFINPLDELESNLFLLQIL